MVVSTSPPRKASCGWVLRLIIPLVAMVFACSASSAQCNTDFEPSDSPYGYRPRQNRQKITYCEGQTARPAVAKGDSRCRPIGFYSRGRLSAPEARESWSVDWSPWPEGGFQEQEYVIRAEASASQSNYRLDCESKFESTVFEWPCEVMAAIFQRDKVFSTDGVHLTVARRENDRRSVLIPARIRSTSERSDGPLPVRLVLLVSEKGAVAKLELERDGAGEESRIVEFSPPLTPAKDGTCSIYLHRVTPPSAQVDTSTVPAKETVKSANVSLEFNNDTWKVTPYLASDRSPLKKQDSFLIRLLEVPQG